MNQTTHFTRPQHKTLNTNVQIYTQIQENIGMGANGKFYNT